MPSVFVCHASEDKNSIARPLAAQLAMFDCQVWYDEYSLKVGDSLRRSIEQGIKDCDFGVVILSPDFFTKEWAQRELDALTAREINQQKKIILPVWHDIDIAEILKFSPVLADRVAIKTNEGVAKVVDEILEVVTHQSSEKILFFWWYSVSVKTRQPREQFTERLKQLFTTSIGKCDYHKVSVHVTQMRDSYQRQLFNHTIHACCKGYANRVLEMIKMEPNWEIEEIIERKKIEENRRSWNRQRKTIEDDILNRSN